MNRKETKRGLAILLVYAMLFALLPCVSFAEDTAVTEDTVTSETEGGSTAVTTYAITFTSGGATSGTAPTMYEIAADVKLILPANTFTKDDYTFAGWNDGSDTYDEGDEYTMPAHAVTFTAQWEAELTETLAVTALGAMEGSTAVTTYAITFTSGGAVSGTDPTMDATAAGVTVTLPDNPFTKDGYTFTGWKDSADAYTAGASATYTTGAAYTLTCSAVTFTAQWESVHSAVTTYAITFVSGGAVSGTAPTMDATAAGVAITLPDNPFTNDGCTFAGWQDSADAYTAGSSATYATGAAYTMTASAVTFTAQWAATSLSAVYLNGTAGNDANGGTTSAAAVKTFEKAKSLLAKDGTIWMTSGVAITTNTTWSLPTEVYGTAKVMRYPSYTGNLVTVSNKCTFTLNNIVIDGNKDNVTAAGVIIKCYLANLKILDGAILQNNRNTATTVNLGGGVNFQGWYATNTKAFYKLTINGGIIRNNESTNYYGGGIYFVNGGFSMDSGELINNTAAANGGGMYEAGNTNNCTTFAISANAVITGNQDGNSASGIFVNGSLSPTISGDARISDGIYLYHYTNPMLNFTSALAHKLPIQVASATTRVVAVGSASYTLTEFDCKNLRLTGSSGWYLALNTSSQICLTQTDPGYSPYFVQLDTGTSVIPAGDPDNNSFNVDVSLGVTDIATAGAIETYIRYDSSLVSFTSGAGINGFSGTIAQVPGESIIKVTLQGDPVIIEADSTISLATLTFTALKNSGTASFSIDNETYDTFVTESDSAGTQRDARITSTASRTITIDFELIRNSAYHALPEGYSLAAVYMAPGSGNAWTYCGQLMYKAGDEKYLLIVTGSGLAYSGAYGNIATAAAITNPAISYDGDVNGDGKVNILDAQNAYDLVLSDSAYRKGFDILDMKARLEADINQDNKVTAADASAIYHYLNYGTFQ